MARTVSWCVLLSISNYIMDYDRIALFYALDDLWQACGLCHMVFIRFMPSDMSQDIRLSADVRSWGNAGLIP